MDQALPQAMETANLELLANFAIILLEDDSSLISLSALVVVDDLPYQKGDFFTSVQRLNSADLKTFARGS